MPILLQYLILAKRQNLMAVSIRPLSDKGKVSKDFAYANIVVLGDSHRILTFDADNPS